MATIKQLVLKITHQQAVYGLIGITALVLVYHLLIVTQIIPYNIVWGGRLTSYSQMLRFEAVSITINFVIMFIAAMQGGLIPKLLPHKVIRPILWVFFVMLIFNTIANPFSATLFEAIAFTPLTFLLAVLLYRLLLQSD